MFQNELRYTIKNLTITIDYFGQVSFLETLLIQYNEKFNYSYVIPRDFPYDS